MVIEMKYFILYKYINIKIYFVFNQYIIYKYIFMIDHKYISINLFFYYFELI